MRFGWLVTVILAAGLAGAEEATLEIRQIDADGFPTVKLFISIVDAQGNPLTDVAPGSFRVDEGGQDAASPDIPAGAESVICFLVIDRSGSMSEGEKMAQAKEAATSFIEMMRPGDRTGVIAFDSAVETLTDPIDSKDALKAYVRGIRAEGETACFSAVKMALAALSGQKGRRSVIVLTDGADNQSQPRGDTLGSVSDRAVELGVPVFAIGLGENALSDVLGRLAQRSHGKYAFAPSGQELVALFQRQAEQIQKEFVLTYASPNPVYDGKRREVRVRATWRGTEIEGTSRYAPSGIVPMAKTETEAGGGGKTWGVFITLAILIGFLGAAPMLLKRAQEKAKELPAAPPATVPIPSGAPVAADAPKGRVRVIAPTQAPPPPAPARVKILAGAEPPAPPPTPDAPAAAPPEAGAAAPAKPGLRVRILPSGLPPEAGAAAPAKGGEPPAPPPAVEPSPPPPASEPPPPEPPAVEAPPPAP